jgi:hypothetical protein
LELHVGRSSFSLMHRIAQGAAVLTIVMATSAAFAQTAAPGSRGCSPPGNSSNQNLTDKLAQSGGVLCPQNVDPAMKAPTPPTGDKPVIRPPGGGDDNPNVQPK